MYQINNMNLSHIRKQFPLLQKHPKLVYFDNAATSLKPLSVIREHEKYYSEIGGSVHRGIHWPAEKATRLYEDAHRKTADFIGANENEIVFTKGTTESLNLLMYSLANGNFFRAGDEIALTSMEHHSNLVPWQYIAKKKKLKLKFIEHKNDFTLDLNDAEKKITRKTKIVSVCHASNTVATINPVKELGKIAHSKGALFCVDAAQSVPHMEFNVKKIGADFAAFSAHKMLGPTGLGVFYGKEKLLEKMEPFNLGGGMINSVSYSGSRWNELPWKFEAGTPPIAEAIAFIKAIEFLDGIGMDEIEGYERQLTKHMLRGFAESGNLKLHCPNNPNKQGPIFLFEARGIDSHDLALCLNDEAGIAIRSGMHCAEPIVSSINPKGLARASLYFYNTKQEIDVFFDAMKKILGQL